MAPRRLAGEDKRAQVTFDLEGVEVTGREGESVATALLAHGEHVFARSVKYHRPRAPFCMTGECSNCLMRVDGLPNVFTCRTPVRQGMRVERQNAFPSARIDVFASIDWLFPRGMDHHEMFAGVPVAEQVMAKVARQLAGLGLLPKESAPEAPVARTERVKVAVVGAGPAGTAAARVLEAEGVSFRVLEREIGTTAVGFYQDAEGWFLAVVKDQSSLIKLYAERFLLAPGGQAALVPFKNNDLPGVISARAASALLSRDRLLPGEDVVFVGHGEELKALLKQFQQAGARIAGVFPADLELKAHGFGWVRRVSYRGERVRCDLVVVGAPPAPRFELARQAGARVTFSRKAEAFVVEADADGRTENPSVYVAGDVTGPGTDAVAAGERAGLAVVRSLA